MSDGWALRRSEKGHAHATSNWKIFTSRLFSMSNNIDYFWGISIAPTFSIALLCWVHRSEKVRNSPSSVMMQINNIFPWRNAGCGWSILPNQLIYRVNAWADMSSRFCISFGEKLNVWSLISITLMTYYTLETVKIDTFETRHVIIVMSWWSLGMIFTLDLMSSYFLTIWTHPRYTFPKSAAAALLLGIGTAIGLGSPKALKQFNSWARLYRYVTGCPKPCPGDSLCSFPLSLSHFSEHQSPVPSPPPLNSIKAL
jgi:hypothetical protein